MFIGTIIFAAVNVSSVLAQPTPCPTPAPNPPPVTISPTLPLDVCIPVPTPPGVPFAFFDDFSWRSFVAMVWPAAAGKPGVPDPTKTVGDTSVPLVFETFKPDWDVFQPNGKPPANWGTVSPVNPCNLTNLTPNDLVLASFSKFSNLGQAGFGSLVGPLPAQNKTYTRYLTAFNQVEFTQIQKQNLYLQSGLGNVTFAPDAQQNNPIDVKSAWIDMTNVGHPNRYYTRTAWVMDPGTGKCSQKTVGLVGLHIVTKTPTRPQWIWSSFEQMDNVPDPAAVSPLTYNDGTGTPMPATNPISFPPPATVPSVFNVTRTKPISTSTATTNTNYQKALASKGGGVWQFYRLVMTQWPVQPSAPQNPGTPKNTFPGTGATTAFSNVTLETFDQNSITSGCMNCHNITKQKSDFLWSLALNAFPSPLGAPPSQPQLTVLTKESAGGSPEVARLRALLKEAASAHAKAAKSAKPVAPATKKPNN